MPKGMRNEEICGKMVLLSTLSSRKEVLSMEGTFFDFLLSVFASVVGYYICKWLDQGNRR